MKVQIYPFPPPVWSGVHLPSNWSQASISSSYCWKPFAQRYRPWKRKLKIAFPSPSSVILVKNLSQHKTKIYFRPGLELFAPNWWFFSKKFDPRQTHSFPCQTPNLACFTHNTHPVQRSLSSLQTLYEANCTHTAEVLQPVAPIFGFPINAHSPPKVITGS